MKEKKNAVLQLEHSVNSLEQRILNLEQQKRSKWRDWITIFSAVIVATYTFSLIWNTFLGDWIQHRIMIVKTHLNFARDKEKFMNGWQKREQEFFTSIGFSAGQANNFFEFLILLSGYVSLESSLQDMANLYYSESDNQLKYAAYRAGKGAANRAITNVLWREHVMPIIKSAMEDSLRSISPFTHKWSRDSTVAFINKLTRAFEIKKDSLLDFELSRAWREGWESSLEKSTKEEGNIEMRQILWKMLEEFRSIRIELSSIREEYELVREERKLDRMLRRMKEELNE